MSDQPPSLLGPERDRASRGDLAVHDHVCGLHTRREDQHKLASKFLRVGLERREQCLYITETQTPAEFMSALESYGLNLKVATSNGALKVLSGKEVRTALGGFTPKAMFRFVLEQEQKALANGFTAFRWGAEMTWLQQPDISPVEMVSFEAALNDFLHQHALTALCQYATTDFSSELLIAGVETHPLLVYDDIVCDNFYYVPPDEYLKADISDMKLSRMLFNIISRERFMHNLLGDKPSISIA